MIESEYMRFEFYAVKWWSLADRFHTSIAWLAVANLFRGAASMTISTAVELDAHFLADLARVRGGL